MPETGVPEHRRLDEEEMRPAPAQLVLGGAGVGRLRDDGESRLDVDEVRQGTADQVVAVRHHDRDPLSPVLPCILHAATVPPSHRRLHQYGAQGFGCADHAAGMRQTTYVPRGCGTVALTERPP